MKRKFLYLIIIVPFFIGFNSCKFFMNKDTYIVVEAPIMTINSPTYSNIDKSDNYFEFWTWETPFQDQKQYPADFKFLGTEVYYRIYSSSSTMTSEVSSLQSLSNSSTTSASAPEKLIESYKYRPLKSTNYTSSPLIKPSEDLHNQKVYIRLTDFQNADEYSAKITVDGKFLGGSEEKTVPMRNLSISKDFNFGKKDSIPLEYDEDFCFNSSYEDGYWYVAMFALAIGRDASYTSYYSNILYLGSITIDTTDDYTHDHVYEDWIIIKEASCIEKGEKKHICKICEKEEIKEIPMKEHTFEIIEEIPSTCTQDGVCKKKCTVCDYIDTVTLVKKHSNKYKCLDCGQCFVTINDVGQSVKDYKGLDLVINIWEKKNGENYDTYFLNYTISNNVADSKLIPGTFKIIMDNGTEEMQTGIFNDLYTGDKTTRSYYWKILHTEEPLLLCYYDAFAIIYDDEDIPLYWDMPE